MDKGQKDLNEDVENAADMADRPIKVVSEWARELTTDGEKEKGRA